MAISHFDFGEVKHEEMLYDTHGKEIGKLQMFENGLSLRYETDDEDVSEKVPFLNIISIEQIDGAVLPGKMLARIAFQDMYGDKYQPILEISEQGFSILKTLKAQSETKTKRG